MNMQETEQSFSASPRPYGYTVLDLFSGIGGFSLGLTRAGFRTVAFCEIEEYPRSILRKHWPNVPIFDDVRKLHATDLPETVDVICGGFPCQPFSVAGQRKGKGDDRHLWPEMFRLVQEIRPTWVIGENVSGIVSMGLDQALSDLEGEGYTCRAFIIPACALNAPHRRDRVWIVAHATRQLLDRGRDFRAAGRDELADRDCSFADTNRPRPQIREECKGIDQQSPFIRSDFERITRGEWITLPGVRARNDGIPNRVARLKALGNAVVPQIPELIGRMILSV
jgi:DNA (cytosine-5)-methyltransferase 1